MMAIKNSGAAVGLDFVDCGPLPQCRAFTRDSFSSASDGGSSHPSDYAGEHSGYQTPSPDLVGRGWQTHHQEVDSRAALPPPPPPPAYSSVVVLPGPLATKPAALGPARCPSLTEPRRVRCHNPYAALPLADNTADATAQRRVAHGISHQPLVGRCRYIAWPALAPMPSRALAPAERASLPQLIVDQVKFELSPPQLRWVFKRLSGVVPRFVEPAGCGTFVVFFDSEDDVKRAQQKLTRRVLFDHNGAWAPANATEISAVEAYMQHREFRQRGQRLPRDMMQFKNTAIGNAGGLRRITPPSNHGIAW